MIIAPTIGCEAPLKLQSSRASHLRNQRFYSVTRSTISFEGFHMSVTMICFQ